MITTLEEAEKWYRAVHSLALYMKRLAKLWDEPEIAAVLGRDNRLRNVETAELLDKATRILADLDPLAVLVLFSVFEATVRDRTEMDVDREIATLNHPALLEASKTLKETIRNGSFAKVTGAYKSMDISLTEEVNQVREYRNWVAHGRRESPRNNVTPDQAINRLRRYLDRLGAINGENTELLSAGEVRLGTSTESLTED